MPLLLLFFCVLWLCGCGGSDSQPVANVPLQTQTVKIGVIAPLNAGLTDFGRGIRNSVLLAVNQANASGQYPGIRFEVDARDDSSTPSVGADAARALAADPSVVGVVGTYNSGVASAVLPILQPVGLVMISPGNTDPSLTLGPNPGAPVRPFNNYFRLVVPDTLQGSVLANFAFTTLNIRRVVLVSEDKPVSLNLVDAFASAFTARGGQVALREVVPANTADYTQVINRVRAANPELIVYGGEFATAGPFRQQASAQGLTVPLMGSDGIADPAYIRLAGAASNGDYASSLGAPLASQPGGARFLADYRAAGFAEPPSDFGPYAYDAANLIIAAVARRGPARPAVLQEIGQTNSVGVTGPLGFDAFGDTLNKVVTVYQVQAGAFVPRTTVNVP